MERSHAILLRKSRLTESSLIVTWLSACHGRIKTVAKGALRAKSRLSGVLDLFHLCEIQFQPARSGDLHSLRDASLLQPFAGLRTDYPRICMASYAVELVERSTEAAFPVPEIFSLFERALRYLDVNPASLRALRHFERELVRLLGVSDPAVPAELVLERLLHRLPASREDLLRRITPAGGGQENLRG